MEASGWFDYLFLFSISIQIKTKNKFDCSVRDIFLKIFSTLGPKLENTIVNYV